MLDIKQLKKLYGSVEVINMQHLLLPAGKYWIKGANGSGKSTFLKVLAGLLPFKGDIILNNQYSINKNYVAYRKYVNYAPAEPIYPSFLSGQELIDFYSEIKKGDKQIIHTVKNILGIGNYINNPTGSYSSGMLKKLSLLLAFIGNPLLILLDEPFTTLDTETQKALHQLINSEKNISFILTSHHDISLSEIHFEKIFTMRHKSLTNE